ncbi:hypothetical protein [Clostridium cylindrosporum]|uniref:Uncharacterized protein n=1 Tax=Clostridium cylindrosporum DSM 605 TaxID=1121307 RepID=A0A0J8DDP9_CLOCY|nr:hypothetical protein [Clostridium cylindrosporum]KMT22359.1 hypothetical protein CLCY_18c00050 [Clostridium cylindrosporum DSM 605]
MEIMFKGINQLGKRNMIYCVILAFVLNVATLVIDNENVIVYITTILLYLNIVMMFIFLHGFWKTFSMESIYVHILPISKRRIFINIFLHWLTCYTLVWIINIVFTFAKVGINTVRSNTTTIGIVMEYSIDYIIPILSLLCLCFIISLKKIYNLNIFVLIILIIGIVKVESIINININYTYYNNINTYSLNSTRQLKPLNNHIMPEENSNVIVVNSETTRELGGIITYSLVSLVLGVVCIWNLERYNLEDVVKVMERRALYERKWYDKWI